MKDLVPRLALKDENLCKTSQPKRQRSHIDANHDSFPENSILFYGVGFGLSMN